LKKAYDFVSWRKSLFGMMFGRQPLRDLYPKALFGFDSRKLEDL
jgi:hypothetical protein